MQDTANQNKTAAQVMEVEDDQNDEQQVPEAVGGQPEGKQFYNLERLLENQSTIHQFRTGLQEDSFYGVILRYLETNYLDIDLTIQLRKLFINAAKRYSVQRISPILKR